MSKKIAIVQSSYIPWKGYFDMINRVDEFVLYDDTQYTKRDWRNRNQIKTGKGLDWLTIPVEVKGRFLQKIKDTKVSNRVWPRTHWKSITHHYKAAKYFGEYAPALEKAYRECEDEEYLSRINRKFLELICGILGIRTRISWSMDHPLSEGKTERLVGLCESTGADLYLSGPSAKDYIVPELFRSAGIELRYMEYSGYPVYPQLYGKFEHHVTVLDLLFNTGPEAMNYLKSLP